MLLLCLHIFRKIAKNFNSQSWAAYDPKKERCTQAQRKNTRRLRRHNEVKHQVSRPQIHNPHVNQFVAAMYETSKSSSRYASIRPHRRLSFSDSLKDVMFVLSNLAAGEIDTPYCFGDCSSVLPYKRIDGSILIEPLESCSGVELRAEADKITLSSVSYVILREIDQGLADSIVSFLEDFKVSTYCSLVMPPD